MRSSNSKEGIMNTSMVTDRGSFVNKFSSHCFSNCSLSSIHSNSKGSRMSTPVQGSKILAQLSSSDKKDIEQAISTIDYTIKVKPFNQDNDESTKASKPFRNESSKSTSLLATNLKKRLFDPYRKTDSLLFVPKNGKNSLSAIAEVNSQLPQQTQASCDLRDISSQISNESSSSTDISS